jgi:hypothetical protein
MVISRVLPDSEILYASWRREWSVVHESGQKAGVAQADLKS